MNKLEIDYSEIPQDAVPVIQEDWEPPIHKFFGKKDARGKMEKEPIYQHQEFPRLMYAKRDDRIVAREVKSEQDLIDLKQCNPDTVWEKNPAAFGYVGAPSFEEALKLRDERAAEAQENAPPTVNLSELLQLAAANGGAVPQEPAKRGRPAKVD